jgi:F-type H+-transporting ATPase subunit epsilon
MATTLNFEIVTPDRRLANGEADEVIAPGANGLFGVRPGHAPLLALLDAGVLTVRTGSGSQRFFVAGGFAEVSTVSVRVLADSAEPVDAIDVAASVKRMESAQRAIEGLSPADAAVATHRRTIEIEKKRQLASKA